MKMRYAVLVLFIVTISGCTTWPLFPEENPVFFPPAPSTPKIVYEKSIRGSVDFRRINIFDKMFGTPVYLDFEKPFEVYAGNDKVYVTDTVLRVVHVVDMKQKTAGKIGASTMGRLRIPLGVAGTRDGNIYVADAGIQAVNVYDSSGKYLKSIGNPGELLNPAGIAINNTLERLYIADSKAHAVKVYSLSGQFLFQFGKGGDGDGMFLHPSFVAVDRRNGNVYVSDSNNFRVQVFDKDGKFIRKFGGAGDAPGYFQRPKGIGVDSDGNTYVVESFFNNFQVFNEKGELLTWVGVGGKTGGGVFLSPAGLYIDENDKIYVVDSLNRRVQVFQYISEKWKQSHQEEYERYRSLMESQK